MDYIAIPVTPGKSNKAKILPAVSEQEKRLSGKHLGLSMVEYAAAFHSHAAARISWHSHEWHQLILLLRGKTEYEFGGGSRLDLQGHQFIVIPPRMAHRGLNDLRMPSMVCAIVFDPGHPQARGNAFTKEEMKWLRAQFEYRHPCALPMSATLRRMAQSLHQAIRQHPPARVSPDSLAALRLLVASIILEVARHSGGARQQRSTDTVALATAHMERHYGQPIQMYDLAERAGCSRSQLFAVFKRETGMSPNDWLQRHRVKKAGELLARTNRTLDDIAAAVGFSSSQYFCHVFRKYTGKTPGGHRLSSAR